MNKNNHSFVCIFAMLILSTISSLSAMTQEEINFTKKSKRIVRTNLFVSSLASRDIENDPFDEDATKCALNLYRASLNLLKNPLYVDSKKQIIISKIENKIAEITELNNCKQN